MTLVVEMLDEVGNSSIGCPVHEEESALVRGILPNIVVAVMSRYMGSRIMKLPSIGS